MVSHVDYTEHDISIVVTEQGVADIRGLSPGERADVRIENCAHPSFRDDLHRYRERAEDQGGHVPHELETCFTWQREPE